MRARGGWLWVLMVLLWSAPVWALGIAWNASPGAVGYYVCHGLESGRYHWCTDVGAVTSYSFPAIQGEVYYVVVSAYDANRVESGYSAELQIGVTNDVSLTRDLSMVQAGQPISASWAVSPGPTQELDWIGLVLVGSPPSNYLPFDGAGEQAWTYTDGLLMGDFTITAPLQAGAYEFIYCLNDRADEAGCPVRSAPFTVVTPPNAAGFIVRTSRWHTADKSEAADAFDPDWIGPENASLAMRPGSTVRYRVGIDYEGTAPAAEYFPLFCTFDGVTWTELTASCTAFPLCIGQDSVKNSGDATAGRLSLLSGYSYLAGGGFFVTDSINESLTVTLADLRRVEFEYTLQSRPDTALGSNAQCQPRHESGLPFDNYLAQPAIQFTDLPIALSGGTITGGTVR